MASRVLVSLDRCQCDRGNFLIIEREVRMELVGLRRYAFPKSLFCSTMEEFHSRVMVFDYLTSILFVG